MAQARIEELEKLKTPAPAFVKAEKKKPPEQQQARKKRDAKYNRARPRSTPTQMVEHRLLHCPECHMRLGGISLARSREIIDVPPPPPVEVTEHRIYKGWCSGCQKWHEAPVDWHDQVVGQGRIGVRLASLIASARHSDASAHSTDPIVPAHAARGHDQQWRDCGTAASGESTDATPTRCAQNGDSRQSRCPSR